eukprot:3451557-Amphidinium_carterae.2
MEGGRQCEANGTTFANAAQHVMVFDVEPHTLLGAARRKRLPDDSEEPGQRSPKSVLLHAYFEL